MRRAAPIQILLVFLTTALPAQGAPARGLCFEPAPVSRCRAFLLTEFGGGVRLAGGGDEDRRGTLFQWNLGAMKNLGPRQALGGAAFFTWSESATSIGIAPRLRRWVSPRVSVDVAPGVIVFQGFDRLIGFNGQLGVNVGRHLAMTRRVQVTHDGRFEGNRSLHRVEWFAGARLNGVPGGVTGIAAPIVTFLFYALLYSQWSD